MNSQEKVHCPTSQAQRFEIMFRSKHKENDSQIASAMGLSVGVVRKWRRKARDQGAAGLSSHMGRPASGPLGHFPQELQTAIREWCAEHPGWGAGTLRVELHREARFASVPIPSRSRISAFMKKEQWVRSYEHHTQLSNPPAQVVTKCHEEWELDAQGVIRVPGIGQVGLLNFGDVLSHIRSSWACLNHRKAAAPDYQLALRRGFFTLGMPERISLDHDSAFFDNASPSPFPSQFHLWLLGLSIDVRFLEHRPPREHAFIERTHQIVYDQTIPGQTFGAEGLQMDLDERMGVLNQLYPSRSLAGLAPLVAFPQAVHSGRSYRPEWEEELLDMEKVYAYLSKQEWFRQVTPAGQVTLGSHRYGLGQAWGHPTIRWTFDPKGGQFVCSTLDGKQTVQMSPFNLSKKNLMGELNLAAFRYYQYAFPWSFHLERANQMANMLGTTL
jgi:transposase